MGTDDLFHKRKARKVKESERKTASIQPYDRVLIVCEGQNTEPYYFEEIRLIYELDSANVEVDGSCGSSPISVVNHAYKLYDDEVSSGDNYNKVFCVIDRDTHETYEQALDKITRLNKELKSSDEGSQSDPVFVAICSNPSFEYWFLLHYNPTTKPYRPKGKKSVGDQVIDDLKTYIPDYDKKQKGLFKKLIDENLLNAAIAHSKRIYEGAQKTGNTNPSTNVHILVSYLQELKTAKKA